MTIPLKIIFVQVLDFGCGTGETTVALAAGQVETRFSKIDIWRFDFLNLSLFSYLSLFKSTYFKMNLFDIINSFLGELGNLGKPGQVLGVDISQVNQVLGVDISQVNQVLGVDKSLVLE